MKNLLCCLIIVLPLRLFAQVVTPEQALQIFAKYPQEKVFVQFDKADYLAGETMLFKAYVFTRYQLSRISTNLYFECLDRNKKVVYKNFYPVTLGISEGSFTIPKKLPEDVYYCRAYTSWMLNFDEKFQFIQPINIYNPASQNRLIEQAVAWNATVHPEGEILLDKVETKVAIRLHSLGQLPQQCTGYLFANTDTVKKITDVSFVNQEAGSFSFAPAYGKTYSIKLTDSHNNTSVISLPQVLQKGATIETVATPGAIAYSVFFKGVSEQPKGYKIIAHLQGKLIYNEVIKSDKEQVSGAIPVDSTVKGIVHITLFDGNNNVAAERLCFASYEKITAQTPIINLTKITNEPRGLNEWELNTDTLTPYTYNVEVLNGTSTSVNDWPDLISSFWLSDLPVLPYKANTYFNPNNPTAATALDLLLMSEKWQRFDWNNMLNDSPRVFNYFPDNYLTYKGNIQQKKKPVVNTQVILVFLLNDSSRRFISVHPNRGGNFVLKNLVFYDTARVYYKKNNLKADAMNIDIKFTRTDNQLPYSGSLPIPTYTITERRQNDTIPQVVKEYTATLKNLETNEKGYQRMMDVTVKTTRVKSLKEELNKKLSTPVFNEPSQIIFDFVNEDQDVGNSTVPEYLNGRVAGFLTGRDGVPEMRGQAVGIYIDEWASDLLTLNTIPMSEIAMVKVLRNPFLLGVSTPVLAVYTKRASIAKVEFTGETVNSKIVYGYPIVEKFKPIEYSKDQFAKETDTRTVLYWNTTIKAEKGKEIIQFYNNDISKKLKVVVIGFTHDGVPIYLNKEVTL